MIFKVLKESNQAIYLIRKNAGFPKLGAPKTTLWTQIRRKAQNGEQVCSFVKKQTGSFVAL